MISSHTMGKNHYICASSCLFLIPSFLSRLIKNNILAYSGIVTTIVSINYWRNIEHGFRRDLDLYCSRFMCVICSSYYLRYSDNIYDIFLFCFLGKFLYFLYINGDFTKEKWYLYHITFHFILMLSGTLTV